jgi:hypothetical protein
MVPWYSLLLVYTAFDIIIQLSVFMGRYDARTMQPAVHSTWGGKRKKKKKKKGKKKKKDDGGDGDEETASDDDDFDLAGCVFDEKSSASELWFDFMADCGDGFNSSYQVARVLADPELTVLTHDRSEKKSLPRGEFLVIGGDLAYPDPSPDTFEKRFFRTFEDALPPPPCFRKDAISTKKPNLSNTGWSNIFSSPVEDQSDPDEVLEKVRVERRATIDNISTNATIFPVAAVQGSQSLRSSRKSRLVRRTFDLHAPDLVQGLAWWLAHPPRALLLRHCPPPRLAHAWCRLSPQRGYRFRAVQVLRRLLRTQGWTR